MLQWGIPKRTSLKSLAHQIYEMNLDVLCIKKYMNENDLWKIDRPIERKKYLDLEWERRLNLIENGRP
jgi:hypothetical protein